MLSLHTNASALNIQKNLANTNARLGTSMTRLGTGYRINSAKDDAAGLQIATRLQAQTGGMKMALQNAQNANSMLQTADGAFAEMTNVLLRMKDLATLAADGSASDSDRKALQAEYDALGRELANTMSNTSYGNEKLFGRGVVHATDDFGDIVDDPSLGTSYQYLKGDGKLFDKLSFQIGAGSSESMSFEASNFMTDFDVAILAASEAYRSNGDGAELMSADDARELIDQLASALDAIGTIRSQVGAAQNRLDHTSNNLANMIGNTTDASGRIMDVDYASESANMSSQQILMQASTAMLKQASSMNQMVLSLVQ